jgi:hypothetical protein
MVNHEPPEKGERHERGVQAHTVPAKVVPNQTLAWERGLKARRRQLWDTDGTLMRHLWDTDAMIYVWHVGPKGCAIFE